MYPTLYIKKQPLSVSMLSSVNTLKGLTRGLLLLRAALYVGIRWTVSWSELASGGFAIAVYAHLTFSFVKYLVFPGVTFYILFKTRQCNIQVAMVKISHNKDRGIWGVLQLILYTDYHSESSSGSITVRENINWTYQNISWGRENGRRLRYSSSMSSLQTVSQTVYCL